LGIWLLKARIVVSSEGSIAYKRFTGTLSQCHIFSKVKKIDLWRLLYESIDLGRTPRRLLSILKEGGDENSDTSRKRMNGN
jgi:hypothetical protein